VVECLQLDTRLPIWHMYMTSELCCAQWTESRSSCNGIQSIGCLLVNVVQADALQLFEPPAELVELGHHVYHVVPFLHVADNASHLEGEIITTHNDCTQPVALTAELMLELACWYLMMDSCCEPVLQSRTGQQGSYFALTSAAVHWSCITAHLYEEEVAIGVIDSGTSML